MEKFYIPHSEYWERPDCAFGSYLELSKNVNRGELNWRGKYKQIREKRDVSVLGLCLYAIFKEKYFVQINSKDSSPDAFILKVPWGDKLNHELGAVEITFYGRNRFGLPQESLLERLSKKAGKFSKLPENYWLLIHIGVGLYTDHEEISNYLQKTKANFFVFSIQEISNASDTTVSFVSYLPKLQIIDINIGEAAHLLKSSDIHPSIIVKRGRSLI